MTAKHPTLDDYKKLADESADLVNEAIAKTAELWALAASDPIYGLGSDHVLKSRDAAAQSIVSRFAEAMFPDIPEFGMLFLVGGADDIDRMEAVLERAGARTPRRTLAAEVEEINRGRN